MSNKLVTIHHDLDRVCGGQQQRPHYNGQDLQNGLQGAATGGLRGGPMGAVVGFGLGFMRRNIGELGRAGMDLYREYRRGQQLDAQRRARGGQ